MATRTGRTRLGLDYFPVGALRGARVQGCKGVHMASANVVEFTDANFDAEVIKSGTPVLVDFWAEWCMPCRMLTPTIEALAGEFAGQFKVGKVDTDSNQNLAVKYGISAIPTVILFKGGQVAKKFLGLMSKDDLAKSMREVAGSH